jgi:hypothetical protein
MTDTHNPQTSPAAPSAPAAPRATFAQRRAQQDAAGQPAAQPPSNPRSQPEGERCQDGRSRESVAVRRYESAELARQQQAGDQPQPTAPGSSPAATSGEKFQVGQYSVTEAELGELITAKATRDSLAATLPGKPEDYKAELPVDFKVPEGVNFQVDEKNPLLAQARAFAHRYQLPQAAFSELLALDSAQKIESTQRFETWKADQVAKLGPTASARVTAVDTFNRGMLGDKAAAALKSMMVTSDIVQAFEGLMAKFANQGSGSFSSAHRVAADEATVSQVMTG